MHYANFKAKITYEHGVVLEGWPLDDFQPPSKLTNMNAGHVLLAAWNSGAARFRRMKQDEWEQFKAEWKGPRPSGPVQQQATTAAETHQINTSTTASSTTNASATLAPDATGASTLGPSDPAVTPTAQKRPATALASDNVNEPPAKKPRKKRSDAGVPRKKKAPSAEDTATEGAGQTSTTKKGRKTASKGKENAPPVVGVVSGDA